ncbi:unnamed protein product [Mytilus coruscus]|uniref:Uncharacterized protein n=1 Tax=Mytilus coruscus TaxID=42192 RepID=A0A6J8DVH4_MYTCO|nr:unnamed protein product [Mytilus coruscus]
MHIVECTLHYFGMESVSSVPTLHVPPSFNNLEEKRQWFFETIGDVVSQYVLSDSSTNECWTEEAIKESNIMNRTKALGAIRDIAENFEKQSKVIVRAKKHSDKSAADDEKIILKDLRKLKPFIFEAGRAHEHFSKIPSTIVNQLNTSHYFEWIEPRIQMFATEIGN